MFKCGRCHKTTKTGERANKLVIETREKVYYNDEAGYSKGSEIVKEINICGRCKEKVNV
jgi:hypothetical protein